MAAKACTFCRIARGELGAQMIFEGPRFLAFLDHSPLFPGHCLLVPREHHETILDLPPDLGSELFPQAQRLARAVEHGMKAEGIFMAINNRISQSVPHLHMHIVPRRRKDGLRGFFWPRYRYASEEEMIAVREAIVAALHQA